MINVVTKSGTNNLHGAVWDYVRNDAFDALDTFTHTAQPFRQNEFGGTLGGPVLIPKLYDGRKRTFFFVAYPGFRYSKAVNSLFRVPTESNLNGDLGDNEPNLQSFSTREDPANPGPLRDPFPTITFQPPVDQRLVAFARRCRLSLSSPGVTGTNAIDPTPMRDRTDECSTRIRMSVEMPSEHFAAGTSNNSNPATIGARKLGRAAVTNYSVATPTRSARSGLAGAIRPLRWRQQ